MIKVLHLLESFVTGGAEHVVLELCRGLAPSLFDSTVIAVRDGEMRPRFSGVCRTELLPKRPGPDPVMLIRLRERICALNIDVVHVVNGLTVVNYGVMAARLAGVPAVASIHGVSHFLQRGLGPVVWRRMLQGADARVAVSDDIRRRVDGCIGPARPVELVYNGIDEAAVVPGAAFRSRAFREWGIGEDAVVAVCVANLREVKGHRYLVEAVSRVAHSVANFHLLLIGVGPLESELRELVSERGLQNQIHFAGLRNDVPACLALCDLFVLPSLSEGTPLCLLEAMRAGLPVIATGVGGIPEIVLDGVTGRLVPPRDPAELAAAISYLIENPLFSRRCAELGRERFRKLFTLPLFLERYSGIFETACSRLEASCAVAT